LDDYGGDHPVRGLPSSSHDGPNSDAGRLGADATASDSDRRLDSSPTPAQAENLRTWALPLASRRGKLVAVIALAWHLAGIRYTLLRAGGVFEPQHV